MKPLALWIVAFFALTIACPAAAPFLRHPENQSLRNEVQHALDRGLSWLSKKQNPDGSWASADYPALTALALTGFEREPESARLEADFIKNGYAFLEKCVQPDGGIYRKKELENYNTAISVMAFLATHDAKYEPILAGARQFLIGQQNHLTGKDQQPNPLDGGIGYGDDEPHSDLSNTMTALEALHATRDLAQAAEKSAARSLDWQAAIDFVTRCQNLPSANKEPWASDDPANKGGFVYYPGSSNAGQQKLASGKTVLRSYGTMSYAGLLSYIYADVKPDDPRVQAAMDWLRQHYTVKENPNMGKQGLFYYYNLMAKTLATVNSNNLGSSNTAMAHWTEDLAKQLINLQKTEGFWANTNGRFWEKDPVLATTYSVLALEFVYTSM